MRYLSRWLYLNFLINFLSDLTCLLHHLLGTVVLTSAEIHSLIILVLGRNHGPQWLSPCSGIPRNIFSNHQQCFNWLAGSGTHDDMSFSLIFVQVAKPSNERFRGPRWALLLLSSLPISFDSIQMRCLGTTNSMKWSRNCNQIDWNMWQGEFELSTDKEQLTLQVVGKSHIFVFTSVLACPTAPTWIYVVICLIISVLCYMLCLYIYA
jgi:hypothetical protein